MPASQSPSWSPDGKFALVCGSYTSHDTSCSLYGVCDLVEGKCGNYFVSIFHRWHPEAAHTIVYFYRSSYLGEPDYVAAFDPETGYKEMWFETCPDWFEQEYPGLCDRLPTTIVGGQLKDLPDGVEVQTMIRNLDGNNHFGPMTWRRNGTWSSNLKNSPGKLYVVTAKAAGYTSIPLSYTIQVSGTEAYILVDGKVTIDTATKLDFSFQRSD